MRGRIPDTAVRHSDTVRHADTPARRFADLRRARRLQWARGMPAYNITLDHRTGAIFVTGKDGRQHDMPALAAAEAAAARGDAEAAALLRSVDYSVADDGTPLPDAELAARLATAHLDCPECRAAHERGEPAFDITPVDLAAIEAASWCGPPDAPASIDGAPVAWRASDLISFGPGPNRHRRERRRARARARARRRILA